MMTTGPGSPLPHGFVVPPNDVVNDDAENPNSPAEEIDEETARAEALGYADPEDAPVSDHGHEGRRGDDASGDRDQEPGEA